jgi:hypothetical protein
MSEKGLERAKSREAAELKANHHEVNPRFGTGEGKFFGSSALPSGTLTFIDAASPSTRAQNEFARNCWWRDPACW